MRVRDELKEQAIREKAIEMIVKVGFDGLSMQKLAKAANVSPATIYLYFKNREDLLNQLYMTVDEVFTDNTLKGFDPEMSFEDGLWLQWKNRFNHHVKYPHHILFMEQFRSSPLVNHKDIKITKFKAAMESFFCNAIERGELREFPLEVFWAIAYGPLYTLIKFHMSKKSLAGRKFSLTEERMREAFEVVVRALKK
ncbi:TetR/AcrR family transcriptional regulator [Chryseolinea lacunae]|uniref:TetR/AcrR family transcriptional regulator n=1 Tax=Chryseolinea lacunae TaxID=2801331 RepID=A0ABS1KR44_9BACT|nr:TetR/AcrR family transcriptional regulator [Chryseolinea lacunae]MBL0741687.1 TetR/AcrR family transcriptional regulator [Chryseolinea lacunae]